MSVTLAIESSCDESSVALVENGRRVLANLVYSQEQAHAPFGGVVPELAARAHLEKLPGLVRSALAQVGLDGEGVDRVAVTRGPGLVGCLLVGVGLAQGLGAAWGRPVTGVNHLWGHVYAALLARPELVPPLLALVVSGAHSDLVRMPAHGEFHVVGRTRDDAAGEAFDKAARTLGLGYPGGPALDREARRGDWRRQPLPVPALPGLEYSFSGLKTALRYRVRDLGGAEALGAQARADLAAAFERSVVEALVEKLRRALDEWPVGDVVVCGGVAANTLLRERAAAALEGRARLTVPPLALCTDNAAMIAAAAPHAPRGGDLRADPSLGW
ncbi:MAG TPA: tRNA (adenosine(37)-N6)-threonylcarbamoyltransferase complex transferase subunit TsaD [Terriglobales bacterium]|nr:tRNA (adenosine(37)-N6)-threonylcarbamoyltransferase complex transferase subunit TsaD [Terriglobales bacterium]